MKSKHATMNQDKFTNRTNAFKQRMAHVADGLEVREFRPLKLDRAMQRAIERTREAYALPSLVR